jgi:hypothetical protein
MEKQWGKEKTDPIHFARQKHARADVASIVYSAGGGVRPPQAKGFL